MAANQTVRLGSSPKLMEGTRQHFILSLWFLESPTLYWSSNEVNYSQLLTNILELWMYQISESMILVHHDDTFVHCAIMYILPFHAAVVNALPDVTSARGRRRWIVYTARVISSLRMALVLVSVGQGHILKSCQGENKCVYGRSRATTFLRIQNYSQTWVLFCSVSIASLKERW